MTLSRRQVLAKLSVAALAAAAPVRSVSAADDAPRPVQLPEDEGVHPDAQTEWWYYTGHLRSEDGRLFGFEHVFFRARRGLLIGWAAHSAITDGAAERFTYDQKAIIGDGSIVQSDVGMDFRFDEWVIAGIDGEDRLRSAIDGYAFALQLSSLKPVVLHDGDGYFTNGLGSASYYYSRTRMAVTGVLAIEGEGELPVTGEAWMDHQWGPFTSFSDGGWDWWSVHLDDFTEVMLFTIRDGDGVESMRVGTFIDAEGAAVEIPSEAIGIEALATWTSPESGGVYPSGWRIDLPDQDMVMTLQPVLLDQELDTRRTTLVTYWEGQVLVEATVGGVAVGGLGYVELTGYAAERDGTVP